MNLNPVVSPILVIGFGNTLRGDDGAGPEVAERIERMGILNVSALTCPLLPPELADRLSQARRVIFVDAEVNGPRDVQLQKVCPAATSQLMGHASSPATLLAVCRDVFGRVPEAYLITVPAEDMGAGERFSPATELGIQKAVALVRAFAQSHA